MATYFIDLNRMFFEQNTLTPTKGAVNFVNKLADKGNQIILLTKTIHENNSKIDLHRTEKILEKLEEEKPGFLKHLFKKKEEEPIPEKLIEEAKATGKTILCASKYNVLKTEELLSNGLC